MHRDGFWAPVEATRDDDCERHAAALTTELRKLSPGEIVALTTSASSCGRRHTPGICGERRT